MPPGIGYGPQNPQASAPSYGPSQQQQRNRGIGSYILPSSYRVHQETGEPIMSSFPVAQRGPMGQPQFNYNTPEALAFAPQIASAYPGLDPELLNQLAFMSLNSGSLSPLDAVPIRYHQLTGQSPNFFGGL